MYKQKTYPICIRISERCLKARRYLQKMDINPDYYFREGGENAVIKKVFLIAVNFFEMTESLLETWR